MPIYEYVCSKCNVVSEVLLRGPADEPTACPKCGWRGISRQMSVTAKPTSSKDTDSFCESADLCPGAGRSCSAGCPHLH